MPPNKYFCTRGQQCIYTYIYIYNHSKINQVVTSRELQIHQFCLKSCNFYWRALRITNHMVSIICSVMATTASIKESISWDTTFYHDRWSDTMARISNATRMWDVYTSMPNINGGLAKPWGRALGCLLWIQTLIDVLIQSLHCCYTGPRYNSTRMNMVWTMDGNNNRVNIQRLARSLPPVIASSNGNIFCLTGLLWGESPAGMVLVL